MIQKTDRESYEGPFADSPERPQGSQGGHVVLHLVPHVDGVFERFGRFLCSVFDEGEDSAGNPLRSFLLRNEKHEISKHVVSYFLNFIVFQTGLHGRHSFHIFEIFFFFLTLHFYS